VLSFLQLLLSTSRPPRYVASRDQAIFEVSAEDDCLPIVLRGCPTELWGNPSGLRGNEVHIESLAGKPLGEMSALRPKAVIRGATAHVCFVPIADILMVPRTHWF
jgi:hypothetical protein